MCPDRCPRPFLPSRQSTRTEVPQLQCLLLPLSPLHHRISGRISRAAHPPPDPLQTALQLLPECLKPLNSLQPSRQTRLTCRLCPLPAACPRARRDLCSTSTWPTATIACPARLSRPIVDLARVNDAVWAWGWDIRRMRIGETGIATESEVDAEVTDMDMAMGRATGRADRRHESRDTNMERGVHII